MKLIIGHCYKHLPTGEILKLVDVRKRYGRNKQGKLSPSVMTAFFDNILKHNGQTTHQVRYMVASDWQHLGEFNNVKAGNGSVDVFVLNGRERQLSEVA